MHLPALPNVPIRMVSYSTAQRQLATRTQSVGSAPEGDITTTRYEHVGACWDFFCVEQSLPVTSAGILKLPAHAIDYQAYYAWMETRSQCYG